MTITEEDRKVAEEWERKQDTDDIASWQVDEMLREAVLFGIDHERKRWERYHPEPGFNHMLLTPKEPFDILEQVGEKHWKIKDSFEGIERTKNPFIKDGHE